MVRRFQIEGWGAGGEEMEFSNWGRSSDRFGVWMVRRFQIGGSSELVEMQRVMRFQIEGKLRAGWGA